MALFKIDISPKSGLTKLSTGPFPTGAQLGQLVFELDTGITWRLGQSGWWKVRPGSKRSDRNGINKSVCMYDALSVAPHAATARAQYIVPAGKLARIEQSILEMLRVVVGGGNPSFQTWATVVCASGGLETRGIQSANQSGNTIGQGVQQPGLSGSTLMAGDQLTLYSIDTSTGGACDIHFGVQVTEFDR